jgi:hypothetical protein
MKKSAFLLALAALTLAACGNDKNKLQPLNLLSYGVPLTIQAPDSAQVTVTEGPIFKDIVIKDEDSGLGVNIMAMPVTETDAAKLKAAELQDMQLSPYFSKVVEDNPAGFIFETVVDSTNVSYDFRYFQVKGDTEYKIQNTPGTYTLAEVQRLLKSVEQH